MIPRAPTVLSDDRAYQRLSTLGQFVMQVFYRRGERQVFEAEGGADAVDAMLLAARHRGALLALDSRAVLVRLLVDEYDPAGLATVDRGGDGRFTRVALELTSVDRARVERLAQLAALDEAGRIERRRVLGRARSDRHRKKDKGATPPRGSGDAPSPPVGDAHPPVLPPLGDAVTAAPSEGREEEEELSKSSSSSAGKAEGTKVSVPARPPLPPPARDARIGDARHSVTTPPGGEGGTAPAPTTFTWNEVAPILGGANGKIGMRGTPPATRARFLAALDELTDGKVTLELLRELASLALHDRLRDQKARPVTDVALLAANHVLLGSWLNAAEKSLNDKRAAAERAEAARHAQRDLGLPTNAREPTSSRVGAVVRVADLPFGPKRATPPAAPPAAASGADDGPPKPK